jgi:hypothetical protein
LRKKAEASLKRMPRRSNVLQIRMIETRHPERVPFEFNNLRANFIL